MESHTSIFFFQTFFFPFFSIFFFGSHSFLCFFKYWVDQPSYIIPFIIHLSVLSIIAHHFFTRIAFWKLCCRCLLFNFLQVSSNHFSQTESFSNTQRISLRNFPKIFSKIPIKKTKHVVKMNMQENMLGWFFLFITGFWKHPPKNEPSFFPFFFPIQFDPPTFLSRTKVGDEIGSIILFFCLIFLILTM